jgi:small subunit ribosomal protein S16
MLVIRMQRTGRKGHAQFRVVVQDSRRTPTSGRIVAALGNFNPHTKSANLDKEKASFYLEHGAQPSDRVARLLKAEGVKLPGWVKLEGDKKREVKNADKRRSTRPAEAEAPTETPAETPDEETSSDTEATPEAETVAEAETSVEAGASETASPEASTEDSGDTEKTAETTDDEPATA